MALLSVEGLTMEFPRDGAAARALDGVGFGVDRGQVVGLVGESGCGKSMTALCVMRLVPPPGRITAGRIVFDGTDLLALPERAMRGIRGARIAMIFQEPMTALNPVLTAGPGHAPWSSSPRSACPSLPPARTTIRTSSRAACASAS